MMMIFIFNFFEGFRIGSMLQAIIVWRNQKVDNKNNIIYQIYEKVL